MPRGLSGEVAVATWLGAGLQERERRGLAACRRGEWAWFGWAWSGRGLSGRWVDFFAIWPWCLREKEVGDPR